MALSGLQRAFALHDVTPDQAGADVAKRAGYRGTRDSLRRIAHRNRQNAEVVALTEKLRRLAAGETLEEVEAEQPREGRGFRWVGNGRGPDRDDAIPSAGALPFDEGGPWGPQDGPQTQFAECGADIAVYGGSAGSGKSLADLYELAKWSHVGGFRGVIFRRTNPELSGGGGLWDESQAMFRDFGGMPRGGYTMDWRWQSGARVEFRHMQRPKDRFAHQGRQYALVIFDELTHFLEEQFWYLVGRLRSTCGVRPYMRATCNPDPDSFVFKLIRWWIGDDGYPIPERSGVVRWFVRIDRELSWFASEADARAAHPGARPLSFTFIAARTTDNRILLKEDPEYVARLEALPRVERMRLLGDGQRGGNWLEREGSGGVFARADFKLADEAPGRVLGAVRFWDKAASEPDAKHPDPDWTRGVRVALCEGSRLWIDDVVSLRARGTDVLTEMRRTAELDGKIVGVGVWQDTGGAGKTDVDTTLAALAGYPVEVVESFSADTTGLGEAPARSSRAKRAFARAWAPWVRGGRVYVRRGQPWTDTVLGECDGFPNARFDDIVDAISGAFQVLVGSGLGWWESIEKAAQRR